jgi:hypothetical protein
MKKLFLFFVFFLSVAGVSFGQTIKVLAQGQPTSIRGLSVPNDSTVWASGSNGFVAKSTDGGQGFNWLRVTGYEDRDFRDIEAIDSLTAIIMAVAEPAIILKTTDGGKSWEKVFEDNTKGMFLDAMDFNGNQGVVVGDPIDAKVFLAQTNDLGNTWTILKEGNECSKLKEGEAFFASSGSNIIQYSGMQDRTKRIFVSGGKISRLFVDEICYSLPLQQGLSSTGANAFDLSPSQRRGIIVGGDFARDKLSDSSAVLFSLNNQISFSTPKIPLHGYRSGVAYITNKKITACGTSGVDFSKDGGKTWKLIDKGSFHVVKKSRSGTAVFFAGTKGRIGKLE